MNYETNRILSQEKLDKMEEELSNCAKSFINQQFRKISNDMDTYERKYKDALERAKKLKETCDSTAVVGWCEYIFPELKESEDEKIRNFLIEDIKDTLSSEDFRNYNPEHAEKLKEALAWLEKQGEQKLLVEMKTPEESLGIDSDTYSKIVDECIYGEQKPSDKAKPKFHEGEWIVQGDNIMKIRCVGDTHYCFETVGGYVDDMRVSEIDSQFHLWTIQDAKDGDVIACENGWTCIFKTLVNDENFSSYCFMDNTKWFCETGSECHTLKEEFVRAYNGKITPATKEQRDTLFAKMHEAGYEWDADKKELKKVELQPSQWNISDFRTWQYIVCDVLTKHDGIGQYLDDGFCKNIAKYMQENWSKKLSLGQNIAWSEEDEERLQSCLNILQAKDIMGVTDTINTKWLQSLKQRIGG